VTLENASAAIEKWKAWAETGPYDEGKLKDYWVRLVSNNCSRRPGEKLQALLEAIGSTDDSVA
jgi:hypothetical protein